MERNEILVRLAQCHSCFRKQFPKAPNLNVYENLLQQKIKDIQFTATNNTNVDDDTEKYEREEEREYCRIESYTKLSGAQKRMEGRQARNALCHYIY